MCDLLSQGEWTEEELGLLKEAVEARMEGERQEEGERDKDIVQEVTSTYFPGELNRVCYGEIETESVF